MIRTASVWRGKDGYELHVEDVPAWAYAVDAANNAIIGAVCGITKGWACPLCLCSRLDWTFRIGWGHDKPGDPDYDPDSDLLKHSLGGLLFALGQRGGRFCLNRTRELYVRPLSFDEVCEHFPGSRTEFDDDGETCIRGVLVSQ